MQYQSYYFVRHGETNYNKMGLVQGLLDISLNEKGKNQAKDLASNLNHIKFDFCYSSNLQRAYQTAEILLQDANISIIKDTRLQERDLGPMEGKKLEEYLQYKQDSNTGIENDCIMIKRIKEFIFETYKKHQKLSNILVTTHGGVIKRILVDLDEKYKTVNVINTGFLHLKVFDDFYEIYNVFGIEECDLYKNFH
jgi:broad specificity phosphatase PhoE